jgi:hypothetical protein
LKFEFERYLAVYGGSYRYRSLAVKIQRSVEKTLGHIARSLRKWMDVQLFSARSVNHHCSAPGLQALVTVSNNGMHGSTSYVQKLSIR